MKPKLRVLKNSAALTSVVLLERGVAFFLPWYVARILGRQDWGYYSTALTFTMIAAPLAYWGLDQLLPRKVARNSESIGAILASAGVFGALTSALATVIGIGIVYLLNYPSRVQHLTFVGLFLVLFPRTESVICEAIINGLEKMEWIVAVHLPLTILRVVVSIFLLSAGYGLEVLFVSLAVYHILVSGIYIVLFQCALPAFRLRFDRSLMCELALRAVPFVITIFIGETFKQIDRVFLSKFWDTDSVGVYTAGIMPVQIIYLIAPAIMSALFPGLSRLYAASKQQFSILVSHLFKLLLIGTFPIALAIIAFADLVIPLVFGQEYMFSIPVLRVSALGIVPSLVARLLYRTILASDNEHLAVGVSLTNSIVSLILNILLIPRYGVLGASITSAFIEFLGLIQNLFYVTRRIIIFDVRQALLRPGLCMLMSVCVYFSIAHWSTIMAWVVSIGIFIVILFISRTFTRDDLHFPS